MTPEQKHKLDKKLSEFSSFQEFHSYAYDNNIIFENEEWELYRDILLRKLDSEKNIIKIDTTGLILPN